MTHAPPIKQAVTQFLEGDRHAFDVLFEALRPKLWQLIVHRAPLQEADDLFQETCLSIFNQLSSLEDPDRFIVWSLRIAQRRIHDYFRKHYRTPVSDPYEEDEVPPQKNAPFSQEQRLHLKKLRQAVMSLEEPYREVALLHFIVGLTAPEVAAVKDAPLNTVKSHILRAKPLIFRAFERSRHDP